MIVLRELEARDEKAFERFLEDWDEADGFNMLFGLIEAMSFSSYLNMCREMKDEKLLTPGSVPTTALYAFLNDEIVGKVSVRHYLNDHLKKTDGHIGYGVLPRYQGKGFATLMLAAALDYCRTLGLEKVLLTCDEKNLASVRVIEKNGGMPEPGPLKFRYYFSVITVI